MVKRIAAVLVVLLVACGGDDAPPPDASTVACGPTDDTESGGSLYSCAQDGQAGLCTTDPHGRIQCYPTCTPQYDCPTGWSSYVLALQDASRVCYCMMDGTP